MSEEGPSSARRRLGPLVRPPTSGGGTFSTELEAAAARRLGALALVVAVVAGTIGLVAQLAARPSALGRSLLLGVIGLDVLISLGLFALIRTGKVGPARALELGVAYQVAHAFLSAVHFHAVTLPLGPVRGWTPVAVWAMIYPLVVPSRPKRVLVATLLTAATDPLAIWLNVAAGAPRPPAAELGQTLLPSAVVCVLAPIAARIVYGLTVEVKRAREMGSYRLVDKLGQGGMGEVWRAEHRLLARGAAIKVIRPAALGPGNGGHAREMLKRFEREARATAALRSPHTIEVYDYGVAEDGTFHYVMELLEGYSLQALVDRFGPVPPERAVHLLKQACHSLAEAHTNGLVHRDVKPANLFVCRLGLDLDFVKVLDFGLVKLQGPMATGAEALTVQGAFTGTPGFIPPEVALGLEPIDGRADLYALGCVAYWLLTGKKVFESANALQMVVDHVRTRPTPPSQRTSLPIPAGLERLVLRCLEKDPGARPATAMDLSAELSALRLEEGWTTERAREWWRTHSPDANEEASLPSLDLDPSGEVTRSQSNRPALGQA